MAAKREEQREARVATGLAELDRWLVRAWLPASRPTTATGTTSPPGWSTRKPQAWPSVCVPSPRSRIPAPAGTVGSSRSTRCSACSPSPTAVRPGCPRDLFEGGDREEMLRRIADVTAAGTQVIALLALSDDGAPGYDHENAAAPAGLGVTAFACTPDAFPDLMAAAIERRDITAWAQSHSPASA